MRAAIALSVLALGCGSTANAVPDPEPEEEFQSLGPIVGEVTPTSALIWVRQAGKGEAQVAVTEGHSLIFSGTKRLKPERDWTQTFEVQGLIPNTRYRVDLAGSDEYAEFVTAPDADHDKKVRFVFSGDLGGQNACRDAKRGYPALDVVHGLSPDFFLALGDMIYADDVCEAKGVYGNAQVPGEFGESKTIRDFWAHWRYNREAPAQRRLLSKTSMLPVWDDHEVTNDFGPQSKLFSPGLRAFVDYNPLPRNSGELYRRFRWGKHVELFLLDTRSFRDGNNALDTDAKPKSLLGTRQRRWLIDGLSSSDATWKFVVSSVPLAIPTGALDSIGRDGWSDPANKTGYERELDVILQALVSAQVVNLIFVTTDVHFATGFSHKPVVGNQSIEILELVVGPLSAGIFPNKDFDRDLNSTRLYMHAPESFESVKTFDEALGWYNVGLIEVASDGELTFKVINAVNKTVYETKRKPTAAAAR